MMIDPGRTGRARRLHPADDHRPGAGQVRAICRTCLQDCAGFRGDTGRGFSIRGVTEATYAIQYILEVASDNGDDYRWGYGGIFRHGELDSNPNHHYHMYLDIAFSKDTC